MDDPDLPETFFLLDPENDLIVHSAESEEELLEAATEYLTDDYESAPSGVLVICKVIGVLEGGPNDA